MSELLSSLGVLGSFLLFVVGFGLLIFVHELGHFLVAKWVGIKVTQFAVGFGSPLVAWRRGIGVRWGGTEQEYEHLLSEGKDPQTLGETEYRLNYLPFGGYVKMLGQEDMDPTARSNDPRSFNMKPIWARACVVSAGVVMNMLLAVLLFVGAFLWGVKFPAAAVGYVLPEGPAAKAKPVGVDVEPGLQPGDRIVAVDGKPIRDFSELKVEVALAGEGVPLTLTIRREGELQPLAYRVKPEPGPDRLLSLGIFSASSLTVGHPQDPVLFPKELKAAGVRGGMVLSKISDVPIVQFAEYEQQVTAAKGEPVPVTFVDPTGAGEPAEVEVRALGTLAIEGQPQPNLLGLVPATEVLAVLPGSPAEEAGLRPGDVLARVSSAEWPDIQTVLRTIEGLKGETVTLAVWREGRIKELLPATASRKGKLGFVPTRSGLVGHTLPNTPAAAVNIPPGTRPRSLNGHMVTGFDDMQRVLQEMAAAAPTALQITYLPPGSETPVEAAIQMSLDDAQAVLDAQWVAPWADVFEPLEVLIKADGPLAAIALGIDKTGQFMSQTYLTLRRLVERTVPPDALSGPVGIANIGIQIAHQKEWTYLLFFLGLISVNLAVINFLPMPIVDGGLIVLLIIEKLKGSPVGPRVLATVNYVGLALILGLVLFITYHDFARIEFFRQLFGLGT